MFDHDDEVLSEVRGSVRVKNAVEERFEREGVQVRDYEYVSIRDFFGVEENEVRRNVPFYDEVVSEILIESVDYGGNDVWVKASGRKRRRKGIDVVSCEFGDDDEGFVSVSESRSCVVESDEGGESVGDEAILSGILTLTLSDNDLVSFPCLSSYSFSHFVPLLHRTSSISFDDCPFLAFSCNSCDPSNMNDSLISTLTPSF